MHTDEYEISLSRELAVCVSAVRKLELALADVSDPAVREGHLRSLKTWSERKKQYEALIAAMKISAQS